MNTIKSQLLISLFLFSCPAFYTQKKLGIEVGMLRSQMVLNSLDGMNHGKLMDGYGIQGGINFEVRLSDNFNFIPKVLFLHMENERIYTIESMTHSIHYGYVAEEMKVEQMFKTGYISVPLLIEYNPIKRLSFQGGLINQILLYNTEKIKTTGNQDEEIISGQNGRNLTKNYLTGINLGLNFKVTDDFKIGVSMSQMLSNWNNGRRGYLDEENLWVIDQISLNYVDVSMSYRLF